MFGTASTAIGWGLNQIGQWIRVRSEDKKILKHALYYLLEVHNVLLRTDFDAFLKKMKNKMLLIIPSEEFTPQVDAFLTTTLSAFAKNLILENMLNDLKKLETGYESAIHNLATVDPFIAYRLGGKTSTYEKLEQLPGQLSKLAEPFPNDKENFDAGIKQVVDILRPDLTNESVEALEDDIIDIAWKINPVIWWKMKGRLKKYRQNNDKEMDKYIDSLFTKFESLFKSGQNGVSHG